MRKLRQPAQSFPIHRTLIGRMDSPFPLRGGRLGLTRNARPGGRAAGGQLTSRTLVAIAACTCCVALAVGLGAALDEFQAWIAGDPGLGAATVGLVGLAVVGLAAFAAARVLQAYRLTIESEAKRSERSRIARDLHDGLAQELAFVSMQGYRLALAYDDERAGQLAEAAGRALDESRRVVEELRYTDVPFAVQLERTIRRLAERGGANLRLDVAENCFVAPGQQLNLLRIAGEAVNNGVCHGRAKHIELALHQVDGLRLVVRDDGTGFSPGAPSSGFGLTSIRERTEELGGRFTVSSTPNGTEIEVVVP